MAGVLGRMVVVEKRDGKQGRTPLYPELILIRVHRFPEATSKLSLFSGVLLWIWLSNCNRLSLPALPSVEGAAEGLDQYF